jgi:general secretion pathway protein J
VRAHSRQGFTLIEVIIAIAIFAGITASLFLIFRNSAMIQEAVNHRGEMTSMGRIAMTRMEREIGQAFLSSEKASRPGGAGDNFEDTFETLFIGEDSDPVDKLDFTTRSHRKLYRDSKECSLTEIGYFEEIDRESHYFKLMHREEDRIDGEPTEGGEVMVLARDVKKFNLRYYDEEKNEWLDEWDTTGPDQLNRLPRSVEVTMVITDEDGEEWTWHTKVQIVELN